MNPLTHIPRDSGGGGRFVAIFNPTLLVNLKPPKKCNSFENLILSISDPTMKTQTMCVIVYQATFTGFLCEFSKSLSILVLKTHKDIIEATLMSMYILRIKALALHFSRY